MTASRGSRWAVAFAAFCAGVALPAFGAEAAWGNAHDDVLSLRRELVLARDARDPARESELLVRLSVALVEAGEFSSAAESADAAVAAARAAGDPALEAIARGSVGDAHYFRAEYAEALEAYRDSHEALLELGRTVDAANQLKNIGVALRESGELEESATSLETAAAVLREASRTEDLASTLANLGRVYLRLGDTTRAFAAAEESVELARRTGEPSPLGHALLRLATVYLELEFREEALRPLREALEIFDRVKAPVERSWVHSLIAEALFQLGRVDEAIAAEERAFAISRDVALTGGADNLAQLGSFHVERDPSRGIEYLEMARIELQRRGFPVGWSLVAGLGRAYARAGDLDRAIALHEQAIEGLESARSQIASERYRTSYLRRNGSVYRELVELLWSRGEIAQEGGDAERAFAVTERAKGRSLVEAIRESSAGIRGPGRPGPASRAAEIRAEIVALEGRLLDVAGGRAAREAILKTVDRREAELALVVAELRRRDPRFAALLYPEPVSAAEARSLLGARTALVAYFEGERHFFAFVLTADRLGFVRLRTTPAHIGVRVQNYLDLLEDEDASASRPVGRRLYADLVAPLLPFLPEEVEDLLIAPDGVLNFLPFEALLDGDRYLLERFTVAYAPSASVVRELRERAVGSPTDRADVLMFANPTSPVAGSPSEFGARTRALYENEGLRVPPIPYAGVEARMVRGFVDRRSRIYVGSEATERRLKSSSLDRFHVVHFATHGLVSRRWPGRSSLLLAPDRDGGDDGLLTIPEICDLNLASDLVVLSACRTARGALLAGDGVQGLARAFLHAGSRTVLASLWDVDDRRTAALMRLFYERIRAGRPPAVALRDAKLEMIRDPATRAPRYWAGFVLSGEPGGAISLAGRPWWERVEIGWLAASGALAILAFLLLRSRISIDKHPTPR